jgi:hypothetical protein
MAATAGTQIGPRPAARSRRIAPRSAGTTRRILTWPVHGNPIRQRRVRLVRSRGVRLTGSSPGRNIRLVRGRRASLAAAPPGRDIPLIRSRGVRLMAGPGRDIRLVRSLSIRGAISPPGRDIRLVRGLRASLTAGPPGRDTPLGHSLSVRPAARQSPREIRPVSRRRVPPARCHPIHPAAGLARPTRCSSAILFRPAIRLIHRHRTRRAVSLLRLGTFPARSHLARSQQLWMTP